MFTAMQSAKFQAASALLEARELLLSVRSLVCWEKDECKVVDALVEKIDGLLRKVIP